MNDELKPCPFCGSKDVDATFGLSEGTNGERKDFPGCMDCGSSAESIKAWNTRTPNSEIEALKDENERLQGENQRWRIQIEKGIKEDSDILYNEVRNRQQWQDRAITLEKKLEEAVSALSMVVKSPEVEDSIRERYSNSLIARAALAKIRDERSKTNP